MARENSVGRLHNLIIKNHSAISLSVSSFQYPQVDREQPEVPQYLSSEIIAHRGQLRPRSFYWLHLLVKLPQNKQSSGNGTSARFTYRAVAHRRAGYRPAS